MWHDVHDDWHHGHWHGHWAEHPWAAAGAVGLTSWAYGSLWYDTGYYAYTNPYYVPSTTVVVESPTVNYSQPIVTTTSGSEEKPLVSDDGLTAFDEARAAFYEGDYKNALAQTEKALAKMPSDTTLHEFRGLVLFTMKKYKDAAASTYAVLSVAPGWDWTTMSSLYPSAEVYTEQLRALEAYVGQNAKAPEGHFLLAYHYMTTGSTDQAAEQLEQTVSLSPNDQVSRQLLQLVKPPGDEPEKPTPSKPDEGKPPASVVGNWKAASGGGGSIALAIKADGSFTWEYSAKDKSREFGGKHELAGNTLVLETDQGGSIVGKVSAKGTGFHFQMLGGPPGDPGLTFSK